MPYIWGMENEEKREDLDPEDRDQDQDNAVVEVETERLPAVQHAAVPLLDMDRWPEGTIKTKPISFSPRQLDACIQDYEECAENEKIVFSRNSVTLPEFYKLLHRFPEIENRWRLACIRKSKLIALSAIDVSEELPEDPRLYDESKQSGNQVLTNAAVQWSKLRAENRKWLARYLETGSAVETSRVDQRSVVLQGTIPQGATQGGGEKSEVSLDDLVGGMGGS